MMPLHGLYWLRHIGSLALLLIGLSCPIIAQAQTEDLPGPKVSLTICMVDETKACRDYGYRSYDSEEQEQPVCQKWTAKEIKRLLQACATEIVKVPPSPPQTKVSLGNLFEAVSAYRDSTPETKTAAGRKAMMMVFEWDFVQRGSISLERTGGEAIPSKSWEGDLNNEATWIHHERADSFVPAYAVTWTLTMGQNQWEFKAIPPQK